MQVLHPQSPDLVPLFGRAQRLIGLAVVPQVHNPDIALLLQPFEIGLGGQLGKFVCRELTSQKAPEVLEALSLAAEGAGGDEID